MIQHAINNSENETLIEFSSLGECFVCLHEDVNIIRLPKQNLYIKSCDCDGFIHTGCLDNWFDKNNSCPICRAHMVRKKTIDKQEICFNIFVFGSLIYSYFTHSMIRH